MREPLFDPEGRAVRHAVIAVVLFIGACVIYPLLGFLVLVAAIPWAVMKLLYKPEDKS
jgi:hypothetical protein